MYANYVSAENSLPREDGGLEKFSMWFSSIHGYASLTLCCLGIFINLINISILARKDMCRPIYVLLKWLAILNMLTMFPYIPYSIHYYLEVYSVENLHEKFTYAWALYLLFLVNLTATTHTASIWLVVSITIFRYYRMRCSASGHFARKKRMTYVRTTMCMVIFITIAGLVPNYLTNEIAEFTLPNNRTAYHISDLQLHVATDDAGHLVIANVLSYALIAKLIPTVLMMMYGGGLIYSLIVKGRQRLRRLSRIKLSVRKFSSGQAKTIQMLSTVFVLFLVTELPQGIVIAMSAFIPGFYRGVYTQLGDLMDFMALVSNLVYFVLYCVMSTEFRQKFCVKYFS